MNPRPVTILRVLLGLVLVSLLGCGLADYEDKMRQTRTKLKYFDEEKRLLDEPVELPTRKVKDASGPGFHDEPLAPIYFRPPMGIGKKPAKPTGILHKFSRKQAAPPANPPGQPPTQPPGAAPTGPATPFLYVSLAWDSEKDKKKFEADVWTALQKSPPRMGTLPRILDVLNPDRGQMNAEGYDFVGPGDNPGTVWFRKQGKWNVAVVYVIEKGKQGHDADQEMKMSVNSLGIDDEVPLAKTLGERSVPRPPPATPPADKPAGS